MPSVSLNASGLSPEPVGMMPPTEIVTATNVLTVAESGKIFFLDAASEFVTTLPPVATSRGCVFEFFIKAAPSGADYTIVTTSSEQTIVGHTVPCDGAAGDTETTAGGTTLTFVGGQAVIGDRARFVCDGVTWHCEAVTAVAAGATITG